MQVRWLRRAGRDLDAEVAFVAKENPRAAAEMAAYIDARVSALSEQPAMGRPGRVLGTRELVIDRYPYIVPYRLAGQEIQILAVFHSRRQPRANWQS